MSILTNPFVFMHFDMPHTNANLQMMFHANRGRSTLRRMAFFMHHALITTQQYGT